MVLCPPPPTSQVSRFRGIEDPGSGALELKMPFIFAVTVYRHLQTACEVVTQCSVSHSRSPGNLLWFAYKGLQVEASDAAVAIRRN